MVEAGAKVAIGDVLDERGRETVRTLEQAGGAAIYVHLDVTREEDWNAAVARERSAGSAGSTSWSTMPGCFSARASRRRPSPTGSGSARVNLTGVFLGTKLALPALREARAAQPARQRHRQPRLDRRPRRLDAATRSIR